MLHHPFQLLGGVTVSVAAVFAQSNFSGTITLGSVIVGLLLLGSVGFFAVRANQAAAARQNAESWEAAHDVEKRRKEQLQEELAEVKAQLLREQADRQTEMAKARADFHAQLEREREEQHAIRHDLKDQLAAANAQLMVERAKPDFEQVAAAQKQMLEVLQQLAEASKRAEATDVKLGEVHDLVNSQRDELLAEIRDLRKRLGLPTEPDEEAA